MKAQTIFRIIWDCLLLIVAVWLLFRFIGPPMLRMSRHVIQPGGIDIMRLSGVCNGVALLVALHGILLALSSSFGGRLSRLQRVVLAIWAVLAVGLGFCSVVLKIFELKRALGPLYLPRTTVGAFIDINFLPILVLLCLVVFAFRRRRGVWTTIAGFGSFFRKTNSLPNTD